MKDQGVEAYSKMHQKSGASGERIQKQVVVNLKCIRRLGVVEKDKLKTYRYVYM